MALCSPPASRWVRGCSGTRWATRLKGGGRPRPSAGEASRAAEPCIASATFFSAVCGWEGNRSDPWGILSPGRRRGQSAALRRLFLQLVRLFAQITAEESEDEPPSREEQADARLSERDAAGGNNEGAVTKETEGDGQRDGEEAEQPDQTVTKPQVSSDDGGRLVRCREEVSYLPVSVRAEELCGDRQVCFFSLEPGFCQRLRMRASGEGRTQGA